MEVRKHSLDEVLENGPNENELWVVIKGKIISREGIYIDGVLRNSLPQGNKLNRLSHLRNSTEMAPFQITSDCATMASLKIPDSLSIELVRSEIVNQLKMTPIGYLSSSLLLKLASMMNS